MFGIEDKTLRSLLRLTYFGLIGGAISACSNTMPLQDESSQITDRFGTLTVTIPSNWHDATDHRLKSVNEAAAFRGTSSNTGSTLLLEFKKNEDIRPRGHAGCMAFMWTLSPQDPGTLESTKNLLERTTDAMFDSYKEADIAEYLKRGLSVSVFHLKPQRIDLESSTEIRLGDYSGWEKVRKVWDERSITPLISIVAAISYKERQVGGKKRALIFQCALVGDESRTAQFGEKNATEKIHDILNTIKIHESPRQ
jgi:hypothetical protein